MAAPDLPTVLMLGVAIGALFTLALLRVGPTVGSARVTRWLAIGNAAFTLMLGVGLQLEALPLRVGHGAIWSLLLTASAMHLFALQELAGSGDGRPSRWHAGFAAALAALAASLWAYPETQAGSVVAAAAVLVFQAGATRVALSLRGDSLRPARSTLSVAFGLGMLLAVKQLADRWAELATGAPTASSTALVHFGTILMFCATNIGFMLLLYLRLAERMIRIAQTDELTGTLNRRGFNEHVRRLRAGRGSRPSGALVMIDIDRFKAVNDDHGHAVGDEVLCWFAATLRQFLRRDDLLVRMGGEEFCLLLPGVTDLQAEQVAERIRMEFSAHCVAPTAAGALRITASFGLAGFGPGDALLEARLEQADQALYAAKRSGRNRVVRWTPDESQYDALAEPRQRYDAMAESRHRYGAVSEPRLPARHPPYRV
jgi:diguanylate cyclase (GGDEF)-like protein